MPLPDIGGTLVFHYDAEELTGFSDGQEITVWPDLSGNGRNLDQENFDWPTYVASALNGKPGVKCDGDRHISDTFTGPTTCTTFWVMAVNPSNDGTIRYVCSGGAFIPLLAKWSQNNRWIFGSNSTNFIEFTDATLVGQPCIWTGVYQATGAVLRANGTQRVTGNFVAAQSSGFTVGSAASGGTTGNTFTVCEIVQYDGALTTPNIETIEAYLDGKWINLVPDAPTNPSATATGSTSILVGWDNVSGETGYRVERSDDGTTGWADVSGNLAADTTSYSDTGLTASTQYFYRVIAFNANGDSSPSTTVNATTSAAAGPGGRKVLPSARVRMRNR